MEEVENRYITIKDYINGPPSESDFEIRSARISLAIAEGCEDIVVKNLYLSIDPYQLNRMKKHSSSQASVRFAKQIVPGKEIDALAVGRVVASGNPDFKKDDVVAGVFGWEEYTIVRPGTIIRKIPASEFPLTHHLSVFGW